MKKFPIQINFRADALTLGRLRDLCARSRISHGALLRYLIEQAWLTAFSSSPTHDQRL